MTKYTIFGKDISKMMLLKGVTSADLADSLHVSTAEISFILSGKRSSDEIQKRIEEYLASREDDAKFDDFEMSVRFALIDRDMKVSDLAKELNVSRAAAYYAIGSKRKGFEKLRARISEYLNI